jgi:acid phosphatase
MFETRAATAPRRGHRERRGRLGLFAGLVSLVLLTDAPAWAQDEAGCRELPKTATLDRSVPTNLGLIRDQLIIYRCRNYIAEITAALADARSWATRLAPTFEKAAVVLDIDETSLSNWEAMYHNKFAYTPTGPCDLNAPALCGQREWDLSARAVALAPTLDFFRFVRTLKDKTGNAVEVFFITGRYEDSSERMATQSNLRREGYDGWTRLYLRPDTGYDNVAHYKSDKRKQIEGEGFTIIANVGDQYSDLIGEPSDDHAQKCFKLPNPFYFIPPGLPETGLKCLDR